jgi:hypothetical protein
VRITKTRIARAKKPPTPCSQAASSPLTRKPSRIPYCCPAVTDPMTPVKLQVRKRELKGDADERFRLLLFAPFVARPTASCSHA